MLYPDIVAQMRKQVRIVFVLDRLRVEFGKAGHKLFRNFICHQEGFLQKFLCLLLFLFAFCKTRQQRYHQHGLKFCRYFSALIQIRTAKDPVIDMHILPHYQLPDKRGSQR